MTPSLKATRSAGGRYPLTCPDCGGRRYGNNGQLCAGCQGEGRIWIPEHVALPRFRRHLKWLVPVIAAILLALAWLLSQAKAVDRPVDYVNALERMQGQSYGAHNCSGFICAARGLEIPCTAKNIFDGCNGRLTIVRETGQSFSHWRRWNLQPGDVVAFAGVHVAAYIGDGQFIDSTPERGISRFTADQVNENDLWYRGPIRIERWTR